MDDRRLLAADFRFAARRTLRGNWKKMGLVMLVFTLLTGSFVGTSLYTVAYPEHYETAVAVDIGPYQYVEVVERSQEFPSGMIDADLETSARMLIHTLFGVDFACQPYLSGKLLTLFLISLSISVLLFLIRPMLIQGKISAMDCLYRRELYGVSTLFSRSGYYLRALWLWLLMAFFTLLWALLFFFPAVIAIYRYSMAPYLLWQNPEMTAMEAIRESKRLMMGNKACLFCLHFSYFGWLLLTAVATYALAWFASPGPLANAAVWAFGIFASALLTTYMDAGEFAFYLSLQGKLEQSPALQ